MSPKTGRRAGESGTREAILGAARSRFAELGYDGATVRGIAREAGVDPALVHHYFGTKEQLFVAAVGFPGIPSEFLGPLLDTDLDHLGQPLARTLLELWDRNEGERFVALVRSAVANDAAMRMFRQFAASSILDVISAKISSKDARLRAALIASQAIGLVMARYVIRLPELAAAPAAELAESLGTTLQHYLTGELHRPA